jgi:hypothetical protein
MEVDSDRLRELDGRNLGESFHKLILQDPSVAAAGQELVRYKSSHIGVFAQGMMPGPLIDFRWPIDINADELAAAFLNKLPHRGKYPSVNAPEPVRRAANTIIDRLHIFKRLFVQEILIAKGTYFNTGAVTSIGRGQWTRPGIFIDVRNSDFLERRDWYDCPSLCWTGVSLEVTEPHREVNSLTAPSHRRVVTTVATENKCKDWLKAAMRASPKARPKPKADWLREAQEKWDNLSERSFDQIWKEAIKATDAHAWSYAGAPKKSELESSR